MDSKGTGGAAQVVEAYRNTLATVAHLLAFGVPDSLLGHSRDEIRQSIQELALLTGAGHMPESATNLAELRAAYQSLASFVPYEEANAAARLHHALEHGEYAFLASPAAELATRLSRRIEQEASQLALEFDAVLGQEHIDPLLAEVDAFLKAFERKPATPSG